jgi:hypothetical protein
MSEKESAVIEEERYRLTKQGAFIVHLIDTIELYLGREMKEREFDSLLECINQFDLEKELEGEK